MDKLNYVEIYLLAGIHWNVAVFSSSFSGSVYTFGFQLSVDVLCGKISP